MLSFVLAQITQLFEDPFVTDVSIGASALAFRHQGSWQQVQPTQLDWLREMKFEDYCIDLIEQLGGRLDYRVPAATSVSGDFRVHAVLGSALSIPGVLTVRRLGAKTPFIYKDSATQLRYSMLLDAMSGQHSVLIAGAAGSGKTTLLRSLLNNFGHERVVTIEDAAELQLESPNAVSLLTRAANIEGQGEIDMSQLLTESLRMSPDRIAVGEVRGPELVSMLEALNTGHSGAGATVHANSLDSVARRLTSIAAGAGVSERALGLQVLDAFRLVAFVGRDHRIEAVGRFSLTGDRLVVNEI